MKKIILVLALMLGGCSFAGVEEDYSGPSLHAKSIGEGTHTYQATIKGKVYTLIKNQKDGKYYVVGESK